MKSLLPCFCLVAVAQAIYAQTGIQAYREGDYTRAASLLKSQSTLNSMENYYLGRMYLYGYGVLKSDTLAIQALQKSAQQGSVPAQLFMGRFELIQNHRLEQALLWFKKAAASGDTSAQVYCAGAYIYGVGTKKNIDSARNYLISAARANDGLAQVTLAESFLESHQSANKKLGLIWLQRAVSLHDPEAEVMMSELYLKGDMVNQDIEQAKKLAEDASTLQFAPAYYQLGRIAQHQMLAKEAESYYQQALTAGYPSAQFALAKLYLDPKLNVYSEQKGVDCMLKAAEAGSIEAQEWVGDAYQKGRGVEQNLEKAQYWRTRAQKYATEVSPNQAEQAMAAWLSYGKDTSLKDTSYRLSGILSDWKTPLAVQNNFYNPAPKMPVINREQIFKSTFSLMSPNDIPIPQFYEAMAMAHGPLSNEVLVFPQYPIELEASGNHAEDPHHSLRAKRGGYDYLSQQAHGTDQGISYHHVYQQLLSKAQLGDSVAQFDIAQMYQQGLGVDKSVVQALKYYQLAAAQKDLPAEYQLGVLYLQGDEGLEPNYTVGMEWLTDAAFKGNCYAQYALARIYEQGFKDPTGREVIAPDYKRSLAMYQLASANHYGVAQFRLAELMLRQKPRDISVAGLKMRQMDIKQLYQGAVQSGIVEARLPLAFYEAADADQIKQAQAFSEAMQAAQAGSTDAAFLLGLMYDRGIATQPTRDQALFWYEKSAGNPMSAFILGTYAAESANDKKNLNKATDYLQFSVDKGFEEANYNLAVIKYQQGKPFLANLKKAIELGSQRAGIALADYNMSHSPDSQKFKQSHDLYEQYAQSGDKDAQVKLGYLYERGLGVPQDYMKAHQWYTVAAEQGYPQAQYLLGRLYQLGLTQNASPDYAVAKQWYGLAQSHYPIAAIAYGFIDETVDENYHHAFNEYQHAADQNDPVANYNLGLFYEMGKQRPINLDEAKDHYSRAAQQKEVNAMVRLGTLYLQENDLSHAKSWLEQAAEFNNAEAQYQLGILYSKAQSDAVSNALPYFQKAAAQGHAGALYALATLYQTGQAGAHPDQIQAAHYYKQLAEIGNPDAQYQLALLCVSGVIRDCSPQEGKQWLQKAHNNGHVQAGRTLRLYTAKSQEGASYIESVPWRS